MDFHAVAEAFVDGQWRVSTPDVCRHGRRWYGSLTGRDAADTAFLDNHKGAINLNNMNVTATSDGDLPKDYVGQLISIR